MPGAHTERVWSAEWSAPSALYRRIVRVRQTRGGRHPGQGQSARRGTSPSGPRPAARCDRGGQATSFDRARREPPRSREVHLSLVVALARYGEHALDQRTVCRFLEGHEPEEGSDGGQTQVTRLRAGAAFYLEIGEELRR